MGRVSDKRNRVSELRRQLQEAEAQLEQSRPAEPASGSMVLISGGFRVGQKRYSYAAVEGGGLWFLTGQRTPNEGMTWDDVVDYFEDKLRYDLKFNLMVASKEI